MRQWIFLALILAGCGKAPPTELRLVTHHENGHEKLKITAPAHALPINQWIESCNADVKVLYQSPRVLSLGCQDKVPVYSSFRLDSGAHLSLIDVIQRNSFEQLQDVINRDQEKKRRTGFKPTNNFAMTAQGLVFPSPEGDIIVASIDLRPLLRNEVALLVGR